MTIRFIDGFDHYATADLTKKWTSYTGTLTVNNSGGPTGGGGYLHSNGDGSGKLMKTIDAQQTWFVGVRWKGLFSGGSTQRNVWWMEDGGTVQCSLWVETNGKVAFRIGTYNTSIIAQSTLALSEGIWYYIESKVYIHNTSGSVQVKVNGVNYIHDGSGNPLGSLDTNATANTTANAFGFYCVNNAGSRSIDWTDLYVADGNSSQGWLGDCKVETLYPNGDGNSSGWMGSDTNQTNNYALVDEAPLNSDTDYVYTSTVNSVDTYAFTDMAAASGTIYAVQHNLIARKDDAGSRSIAPVVRHYVTGVGTDYTGTTASVGDSYADVTELQATNPGTGNPWTVSDVNADEFGVKLIA